MVMKTEYSKPQVDVFELNLEGTLCVSGETENSAYVEDLVPGGKYEW